MFLFQTLAGRLLTLVVVTLLVVVAAWWVFIREDNSVQETAADVSDEVREAAQQTPTSPAGSGDNGYTDPYADSTTPQATVSPAAAVPAGASTFAGKSYRIIDGQSEAWYLAPEKLASLPTSSTAKGTTKEVKGEFHLTATGLDSAKPTVFRVDLASLRSDESRRDSRVQQALRTAQFPTATFTAAGITGIPASFGPIDSVMQLTGVMEINGQKKDVTWELKVKKDGEILSILATTKFRYDYFGIVKPDIAGFVTVDDEVTLQVQFFAAPM